MTHKLYNSYYMTGLPFSSKLNAKFLLDNNVPTIVPLSELASKRQEYGERDGVIDYVEPFSSKDGNMFWNAEASTAPNVPKFDEHYRNYWKLNNTQDLIDQFNYVGYHDICNYPSGPFISIHLLAYNYGGDGHSWQNKKGFNFYYDGFENFNQTGRLLPRKCFLLFSPFIKIITRNT